MTSQRLLRGRLLSFTRRPENITDTESYSYEHDGGLLIEGGRIAAIGPFDTIKANADANVVVTDHRPHLIMPGLIDAHPVSYTHLTLPTKRIV